MNQIELLHETISILYNRKLYNNCIKSLLILYLGLTNSVSENFNTEKWGLIKVDLIVKNWVTWHIVEYIQLRERY